MRQPIQQPLFLLRPVLFSAVGFGGASTSYVCPAGYPVELVVMNEENNSETFSMLQNNTAHIYPEVGPHGATCSGRTPSS